MNFNSVKKIENLSGPTSSEAMKLKGRKIRVKKTQTVIYWPGYPYATVPPQKILSGIYTIGDSQRMGPFGYGDGKPVRFFFKEHRERGYYYSSSSLFLYFFQFELLGMAKEKLYENIKEEKEYLKYRKMDLELATSYIKKTEEILRNYNQQLELLNETNSDVVKVKSYLNKYKTLI